MARWRVSIGARLKRRSFKERCHGIVDFQNAELGAVLAIFLFVLAFDDGESLHDVFYGMAGSF